MPGAYSPSTASWRHGQPRQPQDLFPTNNAVAPSAVESQQPHGLRTTSETGHLVTGMQTALNVARRAETRASKLHEAYKKAQEQWVAYEHLAKLNFQKERRRYMRDLERIEKEALEAEDQQEQTRATVRQIALRGPPRTCAQGRHHSRSPGCCTFQVMGRGRWGGPRPQECCHGLSKRNRMHRRPRHALQQLRRGLRPQRAPQMLEGSIPGDNPSACACDCGYLVRTTVWFRRSSSQMDHEHNLILQLIF